MLLPQGTVGIFTAITWAFSTATAFIAIFKAFTKSDKCLYQSTLRTKFFTITGSICFVYAVIALTVSFSIVAYNLNLAPKSAEIVNNGNPNTRNNPDTVVITERDPNPSDLGRQGELATLHSVEIRKKPKSILDGTVLIQRLDNSSTAVKFIGITGISRSKSGPFKNDIEQLKEGRYYFLTEDKKMMCGINVTDADSSCISLEYYYQAAPQKPINKPIKKYQSYPRTMPIIIKADSVIIQK